MGIGLHEQILEKLSKKITVINAPPLSTAYRLFNRLSIIFDMLSDPTVSWP